VAALEQIAYDNALRALDKQERVLEEIRARTGVLLAAASLAASLLVGRVSEDGGPALVLGLAGAAFIGSLVSSLLVLMPRGDFVFSLEGPAVYEHLYDVRDDTAEIHRRLAYDLQMIWERNQQLLFQVRRAFEVAVGALVIEVLALTTMIGVTL
jgi:hypothetical protein